MTAWPYHAGELLAQELAGGGNRGGAIRPQMPDQHRRFFEALPFVVVASLDAGAPVAALWTGPVGFVRAPDAQTLRIAVELDPGDPASAAFTVGAPIGVLGIELATRRRNRANGVITAVDPGGVTVAIRQSFGNCPQYIHPRELRRGLPTTAATEQLTQLDGDAAFAIRRADTFFVATSARTDEATGGVDVSHRGGPAGFVQVDRTAPPFGGAAARGQAPVVGGDVLTIPDFPGNRYFNTLGNLVSDPHAALVFVDFATGDVLHVQGTTEIQWDGPEVDALDGAERLWRLRVERVWRRRGGVALRWTP